jgi:hypothetical protein
MLGAPPHLWVDGAGHASQRFLAKGAFFDVPREGVSFPRAQRLGQ